MKHSTFLEPPLTLRGASLEDAAAVTELINTCAIAMTGAPETTMEDLLQGWQSPGFVPREDIRLVENAKGELVGYIDVWSTANPPVTPDVWGCVHPEWEGQGIGTTLLEWGERRARQAMSRVPEGLRVAMQSGFLSGHAPSRKLLESFEMTLIRHFWHMVIELEGPPPAAQLPDNLVIRTFEEVPDSLALFRAIDEAFQDHWGHVDQPEEEAFARFTHFMLGDPKFDPSLFFLAMDGEQIAAISLCTPSMPEDPKMGWVNILGVRRPWRRQGLGMALLHHTFGEFFRRGQARVGLGVDASSLTGATGLYEKAGMHVVRQWDRYEKELRPGRDLTTQSL